MADISDVQKEELERSTDGMEAEDDERNGGTDGAEGGGGGGSGGGGGGDEDGGHDFQLARLRRQAISETSFSRQMVGRILVEIFRAAANSKIKLIVDDYMEPIQKIVNDPEAQVRSDLVEQLPYVAMICHEAPHLFGNVFHKFLLNVIIKYLQDPDNLVRQTAQSSLLGLMKHGFLSDTMIVDEICPVVEDLSHMSVEFLNSGISLMSKMAPLIGKELTEKIFLDRYIALCEDNTFYVRKICAAHFGQICAAVGRKAIFCRLFPIFVGLCCDRAWCVRKVCVDVMMPVSCFLTPQYRRVLLAEILATHLNDDSKWVRMSAFQILGPFISTFAKQFTNVTYNQQGELVFTSQQDDHFSIRYSYEDIFPTKCGIRSPTLDTEDVFANTGLSDLCLSSFREVYAHLEKTDSSQVKSHKLKIQKQLDNENDDVNNADKYNLFLYYYIPPELPLDDELVKAAQSSSTRKDIGGQTLNNEELRTEESKSEGGGSSESSDNSKSQSSENTEEQFEEQKKLITFCRQNSQKRNKRNHFGYNSLPVSYELTNSSADDIDFTNFGVNVLFKKQETKENEQKIVPQDLIDYFVSMTEPELYEDMSGEIAHQCAFSFPAVTLTLGKENWSYLRKAYQSLSVAKQWKVRRTLASSIHEIAIILGEELTATDLVPIYNGFIKDLDEVRIGVLKHLATFLKILKPTDRCQYLPRLHDFLVTDNVWNWRFREELATQLLEAVTLFSASDVAEYIAPLSLRLLVDKIAAVRRVALILITQVVSHLSANDNLMTALLQELRDMLAVNKFKWIHRQTYALLCAQLICGGAITGKRFSKEMLPTLLNLSWDEVPNVRLTVARTLARNVAAMGLNWIGIEQAEEVDRRLKQMRSDVDRDVRVLAGGNEHPVSDVQTEEAKNIVF